MPEAFFYAATTAILVYVFRTFILISRQSGVYQAESWYYHPIFGYFFYKQSTFPCRVVVVANADADVPWELLHAVMATAQPESQHGDGVVSKRGVEIDFSDLKSLIQWRNLFMNNYI